jgi:hypothetical protein
MSSILPDLTKQHPLHVDEIADVLRPCDKTQHNPIGIKLLNHNVYRGVMVMEIMMLSLVSRESKRVKLSATHRLVVLGQVLGQVGSIVCMELDRSGTQRANVTSGLAMEPFDIDGTHWCSGLAIKQVYNTTAGGNQGVRTSNSDLKDERKNLVKDILHTIDIPDKTWDELNWKAFYVSQVGIQSSRIY